MVSIIIPTYEMNGKGIQYLAELIQSIRAQDYEDYEVIVSDDSLNSDIKDYCDFMRNSFRKLYWFRHDGPPGSSANFNYGISKATGDIIKPVCQDDTFGPGSLKMIAGAFEIDTFWVACVSHHFGSLARSADHVPYDPISVANMIRGENTFGSPSAMAWRKGSELFDPHLLWLMDCEFYGRMLKNYGRPKYISAVMNIREWEGRVTNTLAHGSRRIQELNYVREKHRI